MAFSNLGSGEIRINNPAGVIGQTVGSIVNEVSRSVGGAIRNITSPVAETAGDLFTTTTSGVTQVLREGVPPTLEGLGNITSGLSLPLAIAGVAVLLLILRR